MKPNASRRRLTSRKGSGLRRPNLDLNGAQLWRAGGLRRLEMKLQRFLQIGESFLFALTLACNVDFQALRNIPFPLTPDGGCERSLHVSILSYNAPSPRVFVDVPKVGHDRAHGPVGGLRVFRSKW